MIYEFNIGTFFIGLLILAVSALFVVFHQKIANNLGSGLGDYDRYKRWGLIACGVGFIVMTGLHTIPLNMLVNSLFGQ